ncbi:response regulator transcription factor [Wenyingzhuangia aestuarii]|uniref:response regulator transcription factor n=1 Tax=Wenyingzhuangia aestuarii TaxID=1647582 RepID=UPI00143ADD83|nr:response regulator transcription factor [Wenyingzhuangia aestuarii]NJB82491.1 DNA-binding NarL/FixJ family response regulator [Wenyingzhuangia aestuarii]
MSELTKKYRIILADDNRFFSDALKSYLENNECFKIVAICNTIKSTIINTNNVDFDLLILDLSFKGINSINYLKDIRPDHKIFKIICLSSFDNAILQQEIIDLGVDYMASKNDSIETFPLLIKNVMESNIDAICNQKKQATLSERQIEIIKACYEYSTEKDIADSLNISINTLKSHKQNIFSILNVKNNIELIKFAIKEGLLIT